jgi:arylsulfatase A-like enzyme
MDIPEPFDTETPLSPPARFDGPYAKLPDDRNKAIVRRIRELYYASISLVDKNVGVVLDALEESGELDNTLIIFTSDHGEILGDHGAYQKMLPYDSCARIPFIIRYPKAFKPGSVCEDLVDLNDILPTVLDLAGIDYPGTHKLPGGSLLKDDKDRTYQYMEYSSGPRRWCAIRDKRYKYTYHYGGGFEELYDMQEDPCESINLLHSRKDDTDVREIYEKLKEVLGKYEEKWGLQNYARGGKFLKLEAKDMPEKKRNVQFHCFPAKVFNEDEKGELNSLEDELLQATEKEPLMKLSELELDYWIDGNYISKEFAETLKKQNR